MLEMLALKSGVNAAADENAINKETPKICVVRRCVYSMFCDAIRCDVMLKCEESLARVED